MEARLLLAMLTISIAVVASLRAAEPMPAAGSGSALFEERVQPILRDHCIRCHGPEKQESGLRLDSLSSMLKGGVSGPAVVPHQPSDSLLIRAVRHSDDLQMPPDGKIAPEEIEALVGWVDSGAMVPEAARAPAGRNAASTADKWWSLEPLAQVAVPAVKNTSWPIVPLDFFILTKLEQNGLAPAESADKETLLRRVTFDLTGLPPTREEIEHFLADEHPAAFDRVVDRLLASPHYGEHWGRHWLDLACYAETNGTKSHELLRKPNAYRYRDWVVRSFNDDLPYDQFVLQQIAGDLLPGARADAAAGSGMLWMREMPPIESEATENDVIRADFVDDQIDMVGKTFLGLTVSCARCHDHKFDPISQEDYYGLAGFFYSSDLSHANLLTSSSRSGAANWSAIDETLRKIESQFAGTQVFQAALQQLDLYLAAAADCQTPMEGKSAPDLPARIARERGIDVAQLQRWTAFLTRPGMIRDPVFGPWLLLTSYSEKDFSAQRTKAAAEFSLCLSVKEDARDQQCKTAILAALTASHVDSLSEAARSFASFIHAAFALRLEFPEDGSPPALAACVSPPSEMVSEQIVQALLRKNIPMGASWTGDYLTPNDRAETKRLRRLQWELTDTTSRFAISTKEVLPRDVQVNLRGDCKKLGKLVPRRFLPALGAGAGTPALQGSGRVYLAQQLANPQNPLTARVFVNRVWQHHFSEGLVRTPDNFGHLGELPSHPELLDYLSAQFIKSGWSIKTLHRSIVLSRTYQMSSRPSRAANSRDPDNRLLQHMPVRRLAAEEIRDAMLAAAGCLDKTLHGPSVLPVTFYGTVDSNCRRSIYINVRRGQVSPLLTAFDFPNPQLSIGKRHVTVAPAQSLILLNNEFMHVMAERWEPPKAAAAASTASRIEDAFLRIANRRPTNHELAEAERFIGEQAVLYQTAQGIANPAKAWADLIHALFASNAFLFVR
jgi:cytochrome c553